MRPAGAYSTISGALAEPQISRLRNWDASFTSRCSKLADAIMVQNTKSSLCFTELNEVNVKRPGSRLELNSCKRENQSHNLDHLALSTDGSYR